MKGPILLFGLPCSGTTWISKPFNYHPGALDRHEQDSIYRFSIALFSKRNKTDNRFMNCVPIGQGHNIFEILIAASNTQCWRLEHAQRVIENIFWVLQDGALQHIYKQHLKLNLLAVSTK